MGKDMAIVLGKGNMVVVGGGRVAVGRVCW